jgi:hypothetical protein
MELLEREPFFAELTGILDAVSGGGGRAVLMFGEAGIGKAVLVDHLVSANRDVTRVLWGGCEALLTPRPRARADRHQRDHGQRAAPRSPSGRRSSPAGAPGAVRRGHPGPASGRRVRAGGGPDTCATVGRAGDTGTGRGRARPPDRCHGDRHGLPGGDRQRARLRADPWSRSRSGPRSEQCRQRQEAGSLPPPRVTHRALTA